MVVGLELEGNFREARCSQTPRLTGTVVVAAFVGVELSTMISEVSLVLSVTLAGKATIRPDDDDEHPPHPI